MQISNMGILLHIRLYSLLLCENLSQNVTCYCFCQPISFWCIWNSDRSRKGFYHTVLLVLHAKSTFSLFSKLPSILHIIPNNIAGSLLPIASYHYGCEALPNMSFSCPVSVSLRSFPFGFLKKKRYQKLSVFFFYKPLHMKNFNWLFNKSLFKYFHSCSAWGSWLTMMTMATFCRFSPKTCRIAPPSSWKSFSAAITLSVAQYIFYLYSETVLHRKVQKELL